MDNFKVHVNVQIPAAIKEEGHIIRYLPLYSLDFNLIKFIWAVLKAWICYWHLYTWEFYCNYNEFFKQAIRKSKYNSFV